MLLSSGIYYGHAWLVPPPMLLVFKDTQLDVLCKGNPGHPSYLMTLVNFQLEVHEKVLTSYLGLPH